MSDVLTDSDANEEYNTNDSLDTEEDDILGNNDIEVDTDDDKNDEDTDIEAAVSQYYHKKFKHHSTISTIRGARRLFQHDEARSSPGVVATASSSETTDNDIGAAVSPTTDNGGVPLNYILDNNFSSIFSHRNKVRDNT